jgi:hypothetical protein
LRERRTHLRKRVWRTVELDFIPSHAGEPAGDEETTTVKILLSLMALAGSLTLLASDWNAHAFAYL